MEDEDFEMLTEELPAMARAGEFIRSLDGIPWFANLGEPLTPGARAAAHMVADGLGFPDAEIGIVIDWDDAGAAAENFDWNSPAWEAEELLRADVTLQAQELLSDEAFQFVMAAAADVVAKSAREAVDEAASLGDVVDDGLKQLAIGAAVQAVHQALLALLVQGRDGDDSDEDTQHPFLAKFQLFEFGRWPVGITGGTFNLF
ncbi:MAG: hypothetical protein EVA70_08460 [Parvularculaceae bacterium]|nr:MAG: hypothetical protein EVA70_08460 [Parvularculaceae bacterium]